MGERFRHAVDEELAGQRPPSVAGLIDQAVHDGRRMRRLRTVRTALGGGFAAAVLAGVVVLGVAVPAHRPPFTAGASSAPATSQLPATPAALLELLTRLLKPGRTADYAVRSDGDLVAAQLTLDTGRGLSTVRVAVTRQPTSPCPLIPPSRPSPEIGAPTGRGPTPLAIPETSTPQPGSSLPGACSTATVGPHAFDNGVECSLRREADVLRPDGVLVSVGLGDCPIPGRAPAALVLSTSDLAGIVADPRWGMLMPADIVQAGARRFGDHLPSISEAPAK